VVNQAAHRSGEEDRQRVVVDVEGDGESRESLLVSLAERVARRARSSGRAVALDPMNPRDRRTIHVALRDEDGIATMSVGEGRYRQVVVVPEGAPEYEDALRESREASSRSGS
jgi:spoIIIJ-associated protein